MTTVGEFRFRRSRGIVWAADLVGSSKYLNDDRHAGLLEDFLPRLHWIAVLLVRAAGGDFIKWTGDGFLAWFETPLHRDLGRRIDAVFEACWHLTFIINVTQLGLKPERKFKISHGVTYEHDALLTTIGHGSGEPSLDLIGRSVVLAFRICGASTLFPNIATQRELVEAAMSRTVSFKRWAVKPDDLLKYFKGEKWGTSSLYLSAYKHKPVRSLKGITREAKKVLREAEGKAAVTDADQARLEFVRKFVRGMHAGPQWASKIAEEHRRFVREELYGTLKNLVGSFDDAPPTPPVRRS